VSLEIRIRGEMKLPRFEYLSPKSLQEVSSLLATYGRQARVLAGGTDLLVELKKKVSSPTLRLGGKKETIPRYVIGLKGIIGLARIEYSPGAGLCFGPMTTYADVADSSIVREKSPLLWQGCRTFSRPQIRSAATLVGNLCNASPSADIVPPLIALGARVKIVSAGAEREVPVEEFCCGAFKTVLREGEFVAELNISEQAEPYGWSYQRTTKRTAEDEALVVVAVLLEFADGKRAVRRARIALGSVAPRAMRVAKAETMLEGKKLDEDLIRQLSEVAASEACPRSRAEYRRLMTSHLVRKALTEASSL
jgi:carbon-monoxide dehydrogenase medium subunit